MRHFTDNPFEKMMKKPPRRYPPESRKPPKGSPCRDCGYRGDPVCIGTCYRDLLNSHKGEASTSGQLGPKPLPGEP